MIRRSAVVLMAVLIFAGIGAVASAPAASALARETPPPGCDTGAFCAYNSAGALVLETQGNWSGSIPNVTFVYNNGVPWPGADHVQYYAYWPVSGPHTRCVHYNPGPGHKVYFGSSTLTRVTWRGEC